MLFGRLVWQLVKFLSRGGRKLLRQAIKVLIIHRRQLAAELSTCPKQKQPATTHRVVVLFQHLAPGRGKTPQELVFMARDPVVGPAYDRLAIVERKNSAVAPESALWRMPLLQLLDPFEPRLIVGHSASDACSKVVSVLSHAE